MNNTHRTILVALLLIELCNSVPTNTNMRVHKTHIVEPKDCPRQTKSGDRILIHYTGSLQQTGEFFENTYDKGTPIEIQIGNSGLKAFDTGLQQMCVGEKRKLFAPARFGYGANGKPPKVPPNADLNLDVELIKFIH